MPALFDYQRSQTTHPYFKLAGLVDSASRTVFITKTDDDAVDHALEAIECISQTQDNELTQTRSETKTLGTDEKLHDDFLCGCGQCCNPLVICEKIRICRPPPSGNSEMPRSLNYKHLHYFWAVARWGGITRAAERLHLTPQTLSGQIKQLEESIGVELFAAAGKRLELTEAGRLAYSYADEMFSLGAELGDALNSLPEGRTQTFRVGIEDAMPKSLAQRLLAPALALAEPVRLVCREGALESLLGELALHRLDFVLSLRPVPHGLNVRSYNHRLGESAIGLYRAQNEPGPTIALPQGLHGEPLLLPGRDSPMRAALLVWCETHRVVPHIVGEFDDTALMKAFGGAGAGIFPAPLAAREEIRRAYGGELLGVAEGVVEEYYAISNERRVSHPAVRTIIEAAPATLANPLAQPSKKTKTRH